MDMAVGIEAYVAALAFTAAASLLLGLFVVSWARTLPGGILLAVFLAGVAAWSIGQALPAVLGPAAAPVTLPLMALSPVPAAAFLHLAFAFSLSGAAGRVALAAYAVGSLAALVGLIFNVGEVVPWNGFPGMFVPSATGWVVLALTGLFSIAGHVRFAVTWRAWSGSHRRQAGAVFVSSLIGLLALSGFAFPALGIEIYPWPVLLLPFYYVALVHGILRHRFMVVNLWAQRTLAALLLLAGAGMVSAALAALPLLVLQRPVGLLGSWAVMAGGLLVGLLVLAPLRRLAEHLAFPGGTVRPEDVAVWRDMLALAPDRASLVQEANRILAAHAGLSPADDAPALVLQGETARLPGWEDAPEAPRHVAERLALLVEEAARRLAAGEQRVAAERVRQEEARLVELGQLAATVAHDLRNPLGILRMAALDAPAATRDEIEEQVARMDHLVTDILDYARIWTVDRQLVPLTELIGHAGVEAEIPAGMVLDVDRRAMVRVLGNLIDNARAMGTRVAVFGEAGPPCCVDVCDDGPGVPESLAESLFRPFVSRRPGGTGLGLAIVKRIMEAHGGSVALARRPGWSTCFRLTFGAKP